jgi:predicted hydrocarbon binding protein
MDTDLTQNGLLGIGHHALHRWRDTLQRNLGESAPACLQEIGAAAGEDIYAAFCKWLPGNTGLNDPGDLDAARFGEVLSAFFAQLGWGELTIERLGAGGLIITSAGWAEAAPEADATYPSCFVSSGLFADLLSRLADAPIAIMEIECRSRNDAQCRFLAGAPETLEAAYQAMSAGQDYRAVFGE